MGLKVFAPIQLTHENLNPTNHWPGAVELLNFKAA